jgi:hypothetical protein
MLAGTRAPGAGPRLRADSAGGAASARVAVSGHPCSRQPARGAGCIASRRAEAFAAGPRHPGKLVEIPQ